MEDVTAEDSAILETVSAPVLKEVLDVLTLVHDVLRTVVLIVDDELEDVDFQDFVDEIDDEAADEDYFGKRTKLFYY